ncbi:MAG: hypothetical protein L7V29_00090 [Alphaproteobacteria bacterium]|nr:hypothetical protein [Alphaproteobacteria bacterium]
MSIPLLLGVAYAVVAALLLTLNLQTPYRREIKLAAILIVSLLYIGAYHGAQNLRGWAISAAPPNPFKLHWAVVEEPDKAAGTEGAIYILGQSLSARGVSLGEPRLFRLPFTPELAEQVDEALGKKEDGRDLEARLSYKAATPDDLDEIQKRDGNKARPDAAGEEERLKLDFRELNAPDLPPKG